MGEAFIIKNGGVDILNNAVAIISVTYPQGAKCTCASADGKALFFAENTTGIWAFGVPSVGTWTITCVADDGNRVQRNVTARRGYITEIDVEFLTPIEYQAVTYIKRISGINGSYIDCSYTNISYPFDISLTMSAENIPNAYLYVVLGCYDYDFQDNTFLSGIRPLYSDNKTEYYLHRSYLDDTSFGYFSEDGNITTIKTVKCSLTRNQSSVSVNGAQIGTVDVFGTTHPDVIFILERNPPTGASIFLYEGEFLKNGELVVHLQPCYRKSDGMIGCWDKVRNRFLPVRGDSRAFEKGVDKISY